MIGVNVPVAELTQEIKEAVDYWKRYRNQEIRIEKISVNSEGDSRERIKHGLQGTVDTVLSLPPGFVLTDAIEYYNPEPLQTNEHGVPEDGGAYQRENHEKIFISFNDIERIVFVDD